MHLAIILDRLSASAALASSRHRLYRLAMLRELMCFSVFIASCSAAPKPITYRVCDGRIGVQVASDASPQLHRATANAIDYWNGELGRVVLFSSASGDVRVIETTLRPLGRAQLHRRDGCTAASVVKISRFATKLSPEQLESVVRHELGHVLGLRDMPGLSVMTPAIKPNESYDAFPPHPYEADTAELLHLFGAYGRPDDSIAYSEPMSNR